ncbi:MAG: glycosyltransferase [Prevotellaceae bacterium]|nr:glycosyltransferase [Prevotellaceae bacterium]
MKLLHLITSMNPKTGGVCAAVRDIIFGVSHLGLNDVVSFDSPDAPYLNDYDFKVVALGKAKTVWACNPKLVPWLLENLGNYDVVIVHGLWLYHSYAAVRAWKKYKKTHTAFPKLFVMPHGMLDPYFQRAKERKLKAPRNEIYWRLIENNVINSADGILFTCEEEMLLARTTFGNYHPKREINISYGVQSPPAYTETMTAAFAEKVPQWNGKPFILFLSRIHEKKGVDLLIKAYNNIGKDAVCHVSTELPQLIIAGPLESDYAKEMQNLAENNQNIIFAGMLSGDSKWGAFYNCECFVLPSHQENFGIAIVEAMACRKPVLITDKINIWREIAGENGGLVCNDTENEVFEQLKKFLSLHPETKATMGENAFRAFEKCFSIENAAKKLIDAIFAA